MTSTEPILDIFRRVSSRLSKCYRGLSRPSVISLVVLVRQMETMAFSHGRRWTRYCRRVRFSRTSPSLPTDGLLDLREAQEALMEEA